MKKTVKKMLASLMALCCSLFFATMAYAANDESEWGIIPDGYVLFIPSHQSTVVTGSCEQTLEVQPTVKYEREEVLPEPTASEDRGQTMSNFVQEENNNVETDYTLQEFAAAHLAEINRIREEYGLKTLETNSTLTEMAQERIEEYRLGHKRADGSQWYSIFDEYDTELKAAGENWASASEKPKSQIEAFLSSESHKANILSKDAEYVGIGVKWNEDHTAISVIQLFAK